MDLSFSQKITMNLKQIKIPQIKLRQYDSARLAQHMREKHGLDTTFFDNIFKGLQDPWEKLRSNDINKQMVQFPSTPS